MAVSSSFAIWFRQPHPLRLDEAQEFADACGGDAEDVFLTLSIFVKTLAFQPAGAHHRDQARNRDPPHAAA
jgi:hypothetical protein